MTEFEFNKCTLMPHAEHLKKLFFKYRQDDAIEQFGYYILVNALFMSIRVFDFASQQDFSTGIACLDSVFQFSQYFALWLLREKVRSRFLLVLMVLFTDVAIARIVSTSLSVSYLEKDDQVLATIMIKRVIELMKSKAIFFTMFVCPSMSYWSYQTFIFCCCVVAIAYGLVSIDKKEFEKIILE